MTQEPPERSAVALLMRSCRRLRRRQRGHRRRRCDRRILELSGLIEPHTHEQRYQRRQCPGSRETRKPIAPFSGSEVQVRPDCNQMPPEARRIGTIEPGSARLSPLRGRRDACTTSAKTRDRYLLPCRAPGPIVIHRNRPYGIHQIRSFVSIVRPVIPGRRSLCQAMSHPIGPKILPRNATIKKGA